MRVSYCEINLSKEEVLGDYTRKINGNFLIYVKTEGLYNEIIAKSLDYTDTFTDANGEIVNVATAIDDKFIVYPNTTLDQFIKLKNTDNATVTYIKELTQIS
jgi:hypothetical protein